MGAIDVIRGRNEGGRTSKPFVPPDEGIEKQEPSTNESITTSSPSSPEEESFEWHDEKEVQRNPDHINANAELGLQKAEAAALVYTRKVVLGIYGWIWLCYFMLAFHQTLLSNLTQYVYAEFSAAPQVTTAYITSAIIGGVLKLPLGKTLNLWGRAEGLAFSVIIYLLGMIILAACNGPNAFAAGYTLYWVGYYFIYLILEIFIADTTGLRNRAWAFAFSTTPFICTAFTAPLAATSFIQTSGWRWGFGVFAIVQPFVFFPLCGIFKFYERKAKKMGIIHREPSGRTTMQSIVYYFHEFDVIGACIIMAAFILFLLPFSLTSYGLTGYSSAKFIAMIVIGFLLFPTFAIWEKYFATKHFIRWQMFKNRTIAGACLLSLVLFFNFDLWDTYFQGFLLVVYDLGYTKAGYVLQTYNVGSCFWSVVMGLYVYKTKHFKWVCLWFGLPLMMLGSGLMIHFRGADQSIGYIIMCQIFIAFAGGTLVIGNDMAAMAGGDREGIPIALSLISLFNNVGSSIGYAVCAAIYNNTFLNALRSRLPADQQANALTIYNKSFAYQLQFPVGSPVRDAAAYAWGYSQKMNCIASTCVLVLGIPAILLWKNFNVDKKQVKGTVL
ncbi:Siderochrome iron transporter 2 [Penicillium malachiteum]|uniref:Siderochrome iron transporter 2 n=1 Tax=Penicillium malachiteum TaxID=1324776 RepID=UPI00254763EB|nr:Siderochrome iron transporter 2 [Penicillium malachiteum]KAJ5721665.1 Siderochrome iron transporter 2 [Penicillium malachiteum]